LRSVGITAALVPSQSVSCVCMLSAVPILSSLQCATRPSLVQGYHWGFNESKAIRGAVQRATIARAGCHITSATALVRSQSGLSHHQHQGPCAGTVPIGFPAPAPATELDTSTSAARPPIGYHQSFSCQAHTSHTSGPCPPIARPTHHAPGTASTRRSHTSDKTALPHTHTLTIAT
jgi:hypothetical protein